MTFDFQIPRRRIWLLWLLVLTPFCLLPLVANDWSALNKVCLVLMRLLVVALALALVNGVWFSGGSARGQRLAKEFRLQLPGAVLAIFIPAFLVSISFGQNLPVAMFVYVLGCAALGTMGFSAEFEHRTMGSLLAQPLPRAVLLGEKLGVAGTLLALAFAQMCLVWLVPRSGELVGGPAILILAVHLVPPLFAFCAGPGIALLTRRTLAAVIFTVTVPPALWFLGMIACGAMFKWRYPDLPVPDDLPGWKAFLIISIPTYLLAGLGGSWWQFHRLQWRESASAPTKAPGHPLAGLIDLLLRLALGKGSTAALVRKEVRLHVAPWLTALLSVALWFLWMGARRFSSEAFNWDSGSIMGMAIMLGALTIMVTGAATIAEERELGTLESQLTQPASLHRQWWIKLGVASVIAAALGVVLPGVLVLAGLGVEVASKAVAEFIPVIAVALALFVCAIYASSLSRSTVNAAVLTLKVGIVFGLALVLPVRLIMQETLIEGPGLTPIWALVSLWGALMIALLLAIAWGNLRRSALSWVQTARQLFTVGAGILVLTTGFAGLAAWSLACLQKLNAAATEREAPPPIVAAVFNPQSGNSPAAGSIDPQLAARYGLRTSTNGMIWSISTNPHRGSGVTIDPALRRRYGIQPPSQPAPSPDPQ